MEDKKQEEQSEETKDAQSETEKETDTSTKQEPHGTDWKAEARKWEKRAKASENKAKLYDEAQKEAPTLEGMQKQLEEIKAEAEKAKAEATHQSLLAHVSSATGVPATLLKGNTEEEMTASAAAIKEYAKEKGGFPLDKGGAANSQPMTKKTIEEIKDPIARIRARAQNIELYK